MSVASLFALHHAGVVAFFRRRLDDDEAAREAAQETFLRALAGRGSLRAEERARAWLFGIARHVLHEIWRARRRCLLPPPPAESVCPESLVRGRELARCLEAALERLPESRREALLMRARDDLDYHVIAERLGWPRAKVKNELHRARVELVDRLD